MMIAFLQAIKWGELAREVALLAVIVLVMNFVLPRSVVQGKSMEPNLSEGQRLAASPIPYWFSDPQRGDLVVLHPVEENGPALVKRLIGLPNEIVVFRDNQLYINGRLIEEPYIAEACRVRCHDQAWILGDNEYFIMGDNRNVSRDSRNYGSISGDKIMGKVLFRWWPLSDFAISF